MHNPLNLFRFLCVGAALCACDRGQTNHPDDSGVLADDSGVGPSDAPACDTPEACPCPSAVRAEVRYLFCRDVATWEQARDRCHSFGMELVRIDDAAEQEFVWSSAVAGAGAHDYWIGLTDRTTEGTFVWPDGTPLGDFAHWAPEQPDQGGREVVVEEDCVQLAEVEDGRWNDLDCTIDYLDFICEGPV